MHQQLIMVELKANGFQTVVHGQNGACGRDVRIPIF